MAELTQEEKDARDAALHKQFYDSQKVRELPIFEFLEKAAKLGGWFTPEEGEFLMGCVHELKGIEAAIVEIGSYVGKTSSYFARAILDSDQEGQFLFSMDPFIGSIEHQQFINTNTEYFQNGTTFWKFVENLKELGVYDKVIPIATHSDKIANFWNKPIKILFIDGDHNHDQPMRDYLNFSPFIVAGGYLIFHDSTTPDVIKAIEKAQQDGWTKFHQSGVLTAWKRV